MENEYRDQEVWYRVVSRIPGRTTWTFETDMDSRDEADAFAESGRKEFPQFEYDVRRMSGLGA